MNPVDPNQVRLTGENSFIRLLDKEGGTETTRVSHWRIFRSPAGPGHVIYIKSEITGGNIRIYSDNVAMARWLQGEIETALFPPFGDQSIPVIDAEFARVGNQPTVSSEIAEAANDDIVSLTWHDIGEPFIIRFEAGSMPNTKHGVYSCLIPCASAQVSINGVAAKGTPQPEEMAGHMSSTACLAWGETWVLPR
ncbi:MAG: hypothetical protein O2854_08005 [Chloroflexi bacterium]|nr:hypothetical protein [Chloroflexota bacterium]